MVYDAACPVCGKVNHNLYLEETDGWMECEYCGTSKRVRKSVNSVKPRLARAAKPVRRIIRTHEIVPQP